MIRAKALIARLIGASVILTIPSSGGIAAQEGDSQASAKIGSPADDSSQPALSFVVAKEGLPQKGEWRGKPAVGDLNEDGHLDIVSSIRKGDGLHVFHGNGKGGFTDAKIPFNRMLGYGASGVGDLNRDGHLDIAFTTHGVPLQVFLGFGQQGFKACNTPPRPEQIAPSNAGIRHDEILEGLAIGDVNEDGNPDIVALAWTASGFVVFLGDGKGAWKAERPIIPEKGRDFGHEVLLADANGDQHLDILATYGGPAIFVGDGKGRFTPWGKNLPVPDTWGICHGIAVGDVNEDGKLDIATTSVPIDKMLGISVYLQGAEGSFTPSNAGLPADLDFFGVKLGDLDGDGHLDLVSEGGPETKLGVYVWRGDGKGNWVQSVILSDPAALRSGDSEILLHDFDEDSLLDILEVYSHSPGGIRVWLQRRGEQTR